MSPQKVQNSVLWVRWQHFILGNCNALQWPTLRFCFLFLFMDCFNEVFLSFCYVFWCLDTWGLADSGGDCSAQGYQFLVNHLSVSMLCKSKWSHPEHPAPAAFFILPLYLESLCTCPNRPRVKCQLTRAAPIPQSLLELFLTSSFLGKPQ